MGKHDRPDLIVAAMPTADACAVAIEYGRKHKVPVLIDIRDEWPSDFFRVLPKTVQGVSKALLASAFRKLAVVCRAADGLLAVSERQLAYGLKAAGRTRQSIDRVFHTGAPKNPPIPLADSERRTLLSSFGVYEPSLVCLYAGTLSKSRPLGPVIDAVRGLPSTCQVTLLIAGQGDLRSAYEAMGKGCSSIRFLGWQNEADLAQLLELADVFVAPYHPDFGFSLPTKMFDYFQIGRPIISSCPGEAEQLITAFNLGFSYRFDDVEAIKLALLTLASDPDLRVKMGERAQRLFRERFEISVIQEEFARHLEALAVGDH
jgi:glycosyltransferase involved in cell wall biosynthesis